jgi:WD40 repeat protein
MHAGYEFGDYWIEEQLHCDDVVSVFLAYHLPSGKLTSLTHLPAAYLRDPQFEARFHGVMDEIAAVQHASIALLFDYGIAHCIPYVAQEHAPGGTMMQRLRIAGALSLEETVERLADIVNALDTLHAHGFTHYGLHPDVLLRNESDHLCLSGAGIGEICYQMSGVRVSMLPYTAPEVFLRAPGTSSVDIYSLGVIAYQMLMGRLPFEGVTPTQMLRGHLNKSVGDDAMLSRRVIDVLRKAMSKIPSMRYRSAGEIVTALMNAAADEPHSHDMMAGTDGPTRIRESAIAIPARLKWVKTQPAVGSRNLGQLYVEALMTEHKDPAEAVSLYQRIMQLWPHFAQGELTERLHRLEQESGVKRVPALMARMTAAAEAEAWEEVEEIGRELLSYDSDHAAALYLYVTAIRNNNIRAQYHTAELAAARGFWPLAHTLLHELAAYEPQFTDTADLLVISSETAPFIAQPTVYQAHQEPILGLAFSPDGRLLASGSTDRSVRLWQLSDMTETASIADHNNWVCRVLFGGGSDVLYAGTWDGDVKLWTVPEGRFRGMIAGQSSQVRDMAFASTISGGILATVSGYFLTLSSIPTGGRSMVIREPDRQPITAVAFAHSGRLLLTGTNHGYIRGRATDDPEGEAIIDQRISLSPVYAIAASNDGLRIAAGCRDGKARLLNMEDGSQIAELDGHEGPLRTVAFSAEGSMVATGGHDGRLILWHSTDGARIRVLDDHAGMINAIAFSPDGKTLAAGINDGTLRLWRLLT